MQASWMILASLFFATMSVCIKFAATHFDTFELVFYRGLIGMAFMASLCKMQNVPLRTTIPMMHVWRSIVGVASLSAWFYAIAHLPLATAMTLNYMSGVWVAAFLVGGTLVMGRVQDMTRQGPVVLTVIAGFTGVVMILRPTIEQNQLFAGVIGLLSGLGAALAYIQVAALGRMGEVYGMSAEAIVFLDPAAAALARYRRKRSGHLQSKGRFLAAQLLAMLERDLWLDNARTANAAAAEIAGALKSDGSVYETMARDTYALGWYLAHHKYRYLRLSYLFFLGGFVLSCVVQGISLVTH